MERKTGKAGKPQSKRKNMVDQLRKWMASRTADTVRTGPKNGLSNAEAAAELTLQLRNKDAEKIRERLEAIRDETKKLESEARKLSRQLKTVNNPINADHIRDWLRGKSQMHDDVQEYLEAMARPVIISGVQLAEGDILRDGKGTWFMFRVILGADGRLAAQSHDGIVKWSEVRALEPPSGYNIILNK